MRIFERDSCNNLLLRILIIVLATLNNHKLVNSTPTTTKSSIPKNSINNVTTQPRRINLQRSAEISRKFACKEPQPRAYNLRDFWQSSNPQNPDESANQPVYMVVKRCDGHSGCCTSPDMICMHDKTMENSTYYEDIEIEVWSLVTNETRRQWIRVEQHAKCSCEITNLSERERLELQKPNVIFLR